MRFKRWSLQDVTVSTILERLGIKAKKIAPTKWVAFCPHPEHDNRHTPAWFIRDKPGDQYHATHCCKSCGFQGGILSLIQTVLGVDREAAREWLDGQSVQKVQPLRLEIEVKETNLFNVNRGMDLEKMEIDFHLLQEKARTYLWTRGLNDSQIEKWGLIATPIKLKNKKGERHRLRGRIIVPVLDQTGTWQAYTARDYTGKSAYKYLEPAREENPSPTAIFGERFWKDQKVCVVCEGAFNALAAERVVPNHWAVAALRGSDPNPAKLSKLLRFKQILVATDNDQAGNKVAKELRLLLGSDCKIHRVEQPEGKDLNDLEPEERQKILCGFKEIAS